MRNQITMRMFLIVVACLAATHTIHAADWTQFRGPSGAGISADSNVPLTWSDTENLRWKMELPGPGSSSPIVLGDRIFVTCYSGYGVPKQSGGDIKSLQRHLVCVSRADGTIQWTKTVPGELPEDGYQGYISEHGYASSTPVTDGERVYCFFGKSGVVAFDLDGKQLWQTGVGKESGNRRWGSGASLILYKDSVIVNASEESQSVRALDKLTGKEQWKAAASTLELAYGTPSLVTLKDDRTELVIAVPGEVWGLNPDTGKLQWFAEHQLTGNICPSIIADGETVFVFGGFRSAGSLALRAGGKGDVSKSQVQWSSRNSSYVATPVLHEGHLYWISDTGQALCIDAKSGELVYRERVSQLDAGGRPVYASPVIANGKMYVPSRWNGVLVLATKPKYEVLAQNRFNGDDSDFNASPAISNGDLFLRSNRYLYCVATKSTGTR
ncbi:serine/threonine protein kinase [Planctomycetia bacterium]|nr:serine/threonine protein kinase [Planctomycetia bacterium]